LALSVKAVTDQDFQAEVLESGEPVLVDFWAPWCGPCRMVSPVVEEVAEEMAGRLKVVKVNVDENPAVTSQYGIMSIPTLAVFQGGQLKEKLIGYRPKEQLKREVERLL
jgi:thioredoxin 1